MRLEDREFGAADNSLRGINAHIEPIGMILTAVMADADGLRPDRRWGFYVLRLRHPSAVGGCPLMQVSKWLGHSIFTLTLDVYGDYIPEEDGGAINNLPEPPVPSAIGARTATNVVALFGRQSG